MYNIIKNNFNTCRITLYEAGCIATLFLIENSYLV